MKTSPELDQLAYRVIGICMGVHRELGPGFPERYYQRALELEFEEQSIKFEPQKSVAMFYKSNQIGTNYLDFDVAEQLILEIKSVSVLDKVHLAQTLKYIAVMKRPCALLVNFGAASLAYHRIYATSKLQDFWSEKNQ